MADEKLAQVAEILNLALGVEPVVLAAVKAFMTRAQGQTGDQFLAEADSHWDAVIADIKAGQ